VAEDAEIDFRDAVRGGSERGGDAAGGFEFGDVALAVIEGERVGFKTVAACERKAGGGIEAAAEQADGARGGNGHPDSIIGWVHFRNRMEAALFPKGRRRTDLQLFSFGNGSDGFSLRLIAVAVEPFLTAGDLIVLNEWLISCLLITFTDRPGSAECKIVKSNSRRRSRKQIGGVHGCGKLRPVLRSC
jgi:hypothetical protein